jgi:hypothetical protein
MQHTFFLLFMLSCIFRSFGQDTLYLVNEHKLIANVDRVTISNVVCKRKDTLNNKEMLIPRSRVRLIAYQSGSMEVFSVKNITAKMFTDSMFRKGMKDAEAYYKHPGGSIATGIVTFATGGILGLVPAVACASAAPRVVNLGLPKNAAVNNKSYMMGYTYRAKKIKQRKVWGGYCMGLGAVFALLLVSHI